MSIADIFTVVIALLALSGIVVASVKAADSHKLDNK